MNHTVNYFTAFPFKRWLQAFWLWAIIFFRIWTSKNTLLILVLEDNFSNYVFMHRSCHIRNVETGVKYWNFCRILNLCFLSIFSWEQNSIKFCIWCTFKLLRCHNSKEIKLQSSIRVMCTSFKSDFSQLKIKKKTKIQNWMTIPTFDANFSFSNMTCSAHYSAN